MSQSVVFITSMQHFQPLQLSASSRPVLLDGEVDLTLANNVAVYEGENATPKYEGGILRLTSHRILYCNAAVSVSLNLSLVSKHEKHAGFFLRHPKIQIYVEKAPAGSIRFSFRDGGSDEANEALQNALRRSAWRDSESKLTAAGAAGAGAAKRAFDPLSAGVRAVEVAVEERQRETRESLTAAFSDVRELMARAREMVQLAERLSSQMKHAGSESNSADDDRFNTIALQIGFVSPVTRYVVFPVFI